MNERRRLEIGQERVVLHQSAHLFVLKDQGTWELVKRHPIKLMPDDKSHALSLRVPAAERTGDQISTDTLAFRDFDSLISNWNAVTLALNSLNRSMGLKDAYPFVLSARVLEKLRFVTQEKEICPHFRSAGKSASGRTFSKTCGHSLRMSPPSRAEP